MEQSRTVANHQNHAPDESQRLRDKIMGVKLRQVREAAGCSISDCASQLQVSPEDLAAWELGDGHPSMPQLESLADYLKVSVSDLWQAHQPDMDVHSRTQNAESALLRQRLAGGLLRAAREAQDMGIEQLSKSADISVDLISAYEMGECAIPLDQLSILAKAVDRDLAYFQETEMEPASISRYLAEWPADLEIPEVLRQLSADQKTTGLIKLAVAFSQISSEELRLIAEALLAISAAKSGQNGA